MSIQRPSTTINPGWTAELHRPLRCPPSRNASPVPVIREVIEDIDVRDLDQSHVVPHMDDPSIRGVWFPRA